MRVAILIIDVDDISGAEQNFTANVYFEARWHDARLAHTGKGDVAHPLANVWNPRLILVNQQRVWDTFPDIVEVSPSGEVVRRQRLWAQFSQPLDREDFPFDRQTFNIQIAAAGFSPDEVALIPDPEQPLVIAEKLSLADWRVIRSGAVSNLYRPLPGIDPAPGFVVSFDAEREVRKHR